MINLNKRIEVSALVKVGGVRQSSGVLVATVGSEVRGVQDSSLSFPVGPFAGSFYVMMVYGRDFGSGETVNFHFTTSSGATVSLVETVTFSIGSLGGVGSAFAPFELTGA